ncbi:MAG: hypothetical protein QOH96_3756 [Blastocatellia bacterium]|jgi:hypothetical protein|nr:hypothetical protein [Blastocatellia bacterium]
MNIERDKIQTQDETGEPAEIDQVEERVEAEMELIEARAKERVAQGLQDKKLEEKAKQQEIAAEEKLKGKNSR